MDQRRSLVILGLSMLLLLLSVAMAGCSRGKPAASVPSGPEPDFSTDSLYVSIDDLKREMDRGARMIILDARPRPDYELDHIAGAISMPFFDVEQRYQELPKDTWIVAYCACPRAESEEAVSILQSKGYRKLKVLYEGYFEWLTQGYPIARGGESS